MKGSKAKIKKLWGGRFTSGTADSIEAFTASINVDARLYRHDIAGSIAHAKMLARQRIIPAADADKIVRGLKAIQSEIERGEFPFSAGDEDIQAVFAAASKLREAERAKVRKPKRKKGGERS